MRHSEPITVFLSSAKKDEQLLQQLEIHLSWLEQEKLISLWRKYLILPGATRTQEIERQLNTAQIILLLISANYLVPDYHIERMQALERHNTNNVQVIPIIARPCDWQNTPFAKFECLPRGGDPITIWKNRHLAYQHITIELRKVVEELREKQRYGQVNNNTRQEDVEKFVPPAISEFRRHQRKVSELKSIHNMLHEIEVELEGLSAMIQLGEKGINRDPSVFKYIEIAWRQVALKINSLAYFAIEGVKTIEAEGPIFDSNTIRKGAPWIKDFLMIGPTFEEYIRDQNMDGVRKLSDELLINCRSHLYEIDRQLLEAIKELESSF